MDILKDLNAAQKNAVSSIKGPVMVIAGAGSGKTRVLTYRIAFLLDNGIDAFNIMALTFTNKASKEMRSRISRLIGSYEARNVWMGTFHSVFSKILRAEHESIGYPRNYAIYDSSDSKNLIKSIVKDLKLDTKTYTPSKIFSRISSAKCNLISPEEYKDTKDLMEQDKKSKLPFLSDIYSRYWNQCRKTGVMDFDDILYNTFHLFSTNPTALNKYQELFKYILVDEYQDTNLVQYLIVKKLASKYKNICVVGDDAQSIYAFRGANIQNIFNFQSDYPDYKTFKLEQNYRSTQNIVNAANSVIEKNSKRIKKNIWTENEDGGKIKVYEANSDTEEAVIIAKSIDKLKEEHNFKYEDFSILYRTNAQSRSLEEALRRRNMPYRIHGGLSFYSRKEIKDVLAYFRLVNNFSDEEALKRIVNYPARGIGNTTMDKCIIQANQVDVNLWKIIESPEIFDLNINSSTKVKLKNFANMIKSFAAQADTKNAYEIGKQIIETSTISRVLKDDTTPEGVSKYENVEELLNALQEYMGTERENSFDELTAEVLPEHRTLGEFMSEVSLITDQDKKDKDENPKITLMTIHASKGLEFPVVHVSGLEENLFPGNMSIQSRADLEEERRLFYVAITRAKKFVVLSYAKMRFKHGEHSFSEMSRFVNDIDEKYLEYVGSAGGASPVSLNDELKQYRQNQNPNKLNYKAKANKAEQSLNKKYIQPPPQQRNLVKMKSTPSSAPASFNTDIVMGDNVNHTAKFGKGKVISIEGSGENKKIVVFFENFGNKTLFMKFAKLEKL